jgi:ATP-dependent helicase HrpA
VLSAPPPATASTAAERGRTPAQLRDRLADVSLRDGDRLRRRIDGAARIRDDAKRARALVEIDGAISAAAAVLSARTAGRGVIDYPDLPVVARKDDIAAAIAAHQVVIVAGETGSGKTTQLPKICAELGRGTRGLIGHTQPRRIAARSVAERIAEELHSRVGGAVGYQVRFADHVGPDTYVKVMTDGILLAEVQHDRLLTRYDTIIIDEAHERSLNIDFLLGYVKQLLPKRPDLKLIITSATIDPQRFSEHFKDANGVGAPIIEVSGRTYPVDVRYRPIPEDADHDQTQAICDAVAELEREAPGDVLVFLSGEREIRDTAEALGKMNMRHTEVVPLYARLSSAEQHRVFQPHSGRRIVLATNVAETSLTVPGIRYVVDPGTARISRYSYRTKVQRLPIEAISQASAQQRAGRCGRLADGICIRLYSEEDFESRPAFTDPEILRTNLASVILQMTALGLGDIARFPFVEPPDHRNIKDGVQLLEELGALDPAQSDPRKRLTAIGGQLVQLPVDPRIARMIVAAGSYGCLREVLVIAAGLSIQDPRERPLEKQQLADASHTRFADADSDFLGYLNLWRYLKEQQAELSSNQFRRRCRSEYLNFLRIREWQDLESQLRQVAKSLGFTVAGLADPVNGDGVHRSLLAGLLSHIGLKDLEKNDYLGARGARFAIFPGSSLYKKQPLWVMASELVETSRLWARYTARIDPTWIEQAAGHLVKRNYSEPHWSAKRGAAMAHEKVTLYGVPIIADRLVTFSRIDPVVSRDLFIRNALVEGDWRTHHAFFARNVALRAQIDELEQRTRRRDVIVDDEAVFAFYDAKLPPEVVSARHFDRWWKTAVKADPSFLDLDLSTLVDPSAVEVDETAFPDEWKQGDLGLPVTYRFDPGAPADGVTVQIPVTVLNRVQAEDFSWQVPGLRTELVTALIRSLPKSLRTNFVPAPDVAADVVARLEPGSESIVQAVARELWRLRGVQISASDFDLAKVPEYLRTTFRVVDDEGDLLGAGKDLDRLRSTLAPTTRAAIASLAPGIERAGLTDWSFGSIPEPFTTVVEGLTVQGFPALVDAGDSVAIKVLDAGPAALRSTAIGVRRLVLIAVGSPVKSLQRALTNRTKLALSHNPYPSVLDLLDDCARCAVDALIAERPLPASADEFASLVQHVRRRLGATLADVVRRVEEILTVSHAVDIAVESLTDPLARADINTQLHGLLPAGFVGAAGFGRLPDLVRYLRAVETRLQKRALDPARDAQLTLDLDELASAFRQVRAQLPPSMVDDPAVGEIRWMLEELRVSFFAQSLGTKYPVSPQRIYRAIDALAP